MMFVCSSEKISEKLEIDQIKDIRGQANLFEIFLEDFSIIDAPPKCSLDLARADLDHPCSTEQDVIHLIYNIARLRNVKHAVEVGTYKGACTMALAQAIKYNEGSKIVSVDISDEYFPAIEQVSRESGLNGYVDLFHGFSSELLEIVPDASQDLIFIDGDHSYEAVENDMNSFLEKIRPGGCMILHDSVMWKGVRKNVQKLVSRYTSVATLATSQGSGVTILIKP